MICTVLYVIQYHCSTTLATVYCRGVSFLDCTRQVYNLGNGGVPVHRDPVDGIVANPGNREWERFPLSFFVVCGNPVHGVKVN
jgi:hypothetical protein